MKYKHVLLAVNFDANAEYLVMKAAQQARSHDALLSVIHIDPDFTELYEGVREFNPSAFDDSVHNESVREMTALLKEADYPIFKHIFYAGYVEDQIIKAIKEYDVDLLVFGHHESSWFHQLTMSSSEPLLRKMPCDLLFVRVEK
ncbi:universal stress protein [Photobacterium sp. BZF1]|uniref:universal stress protein n=1 Tax=Photobacterium sp. BZF1 TaxID=1904457 RepID=UPI001653E398|nr:universal stress protein [Photobacterium sp. BZF1]MBC7003297.1 universal stress protein [Photobacterium sp. BZF1]